MDLFSFVVGFIVGVLVICLFYHAATPDDRMTDEWRAEQERRDGRRH